MNDEFEDLAETLAFTIGVILQSDLDHRQRIALACQEAQELVACAGWMLAALQERVNEQNLSGWRKLRKVVDKTVKMLPLPKPTVH